MNILNVSSSDLKKNVAEILNDVYFGKKTAVINRYGKAVAKIVPIDGSDYRRKNIKSVLDKYFGALPDFPMVSKQRNFKKRSVNL
jgi:antitoxin (DNA-binding transcriptional repressor) of toxin-antitoxin stability system